MDLRELYMEFVMEHSSRPRNYRVMTDATVSQEAENPSCGDHLHLYLKVDASGNLEDISFQGESCALCKASASCLTTHVKGKRLEEVETLKKDFESVVTGQESNASVLPGNLKLFESVKHFPQRISCVLLGWKALGQALAKLRS
ncbi:MAG: Fe-S cluster assembly sulfur transfer protein SufU [Candidatus Methylacidiphilales bacterium]